MRFAREDSKGRGALNIAHTSGTEPDLVSTKSVF